jgi:hypothetical protein
LSPRATVWSLAPCIPFVLPSSLNSGFALLDHYHQYSRGSICPSSSTSINYLPRRTDSLNATQQKPGSHAVFGEVEEELHDAKMVEKHGEEDDLRYALGMVVRRDEELVSLFLV